MKFEALTVQAQDETALQADYQSGREIGVVRLGETHLFFRKLRKIYYISYGEIRRCFRRVLLVPARMCCGKGDLPVESLVIFSDEGELAQIQLPGTRAAKELMEELKKRIPNCEFSRPDAQKTKE